MQKLIKAFENMMVAITFAESGEYDAARKLAGQEDSHDAVSPASTDMTRAAKS